MESDVKTTHTCLVLTSVIFFNGPPRHVYKGFLKTFSPAFEKMYQRWINWWPFLIHSFRETPSNGTYTETSTNLWFFFSQFTHRHPHNKVSDTFPDSFASSFFFFKKSGLFFFHWYYPHFFQGNAARDSTLLQLKGRNSDKKSGHELFSSSKSLSTLSTSTRDFFD